MEPVESVDEATAAETRVGGLLEYSAALLQYAYWFELAPARRGSPEQPAEL